MIIRKALAVTAITIIMAGVLGPAQAFADSRCDQHYSHTHGAFWWERTDPSTQDDEHSDSTRRETSLQYLIDHYPTKDQMIEVRKCVTAQTGFEYAPLPENFGPEFLLNPPKEMSRQASQEVSPEVSRAYIRCIFDLGYEDHFYPPEDQENVRNSDS